MHGKKGDWCGSAMYTSSNPTLLFFATYLTSRANFLKVTKINYTNKQELLYKKKAQNVTFCGKPIVQFYSDQRKKEVSNTLEETQLLVGDVTAGGRQAGRTICWCNWLATTLLSVLRVPQLQSRNSCYSVRHNTSYHWFSLVIWVLLIHLKNVFQCWEWNPGLRQMLQPLSYCPREVISVLAVHLTSFPWIMLAIPLPVTSSKPPMPKHFAGRVSSKV